MPLRTASGCAAHRAAKVPALAANPVPVAFSRALFGWRESKYEALNDNDSPLAYGPIMPGIA